MRKHTFGFGGKRAWVAVVLAGACVLAAAPAHAQDTHWIGGGSDWNIGTNWDAGVPQGDYGAWLDQAGGHTVNYVSPGFNPVLNSVTIDLGMTLQQTQDDLTAVVQIVGQTAGDFGTLYRQSGGTNTVTEYLGIGTADGSYGEYRLEGTGQLIKSAGEEKIGDGGTGYFYQYQGTTHIFAGAIYLGDDATGFGRYEMYGGTLQGEPGQNAGLALGEWGGTGEFYQEGGLVQITDLTLARQNDPISSVGNYQLVGDARLETGWTCVGHRGVGSFDHGGTAEHVTGELLLGHEAPGEGSYYLYESGVLTVNGNEFIGVAGHGTFGQDGDATVHTVHGNLYVDSGVASKGTYSLHAGTLQVDHMMFVGCNAAATGEFFQYGGSATADEGLILGLVADSTGNYTMQGGTLQTGWTHVGSHGSAYFAQSWSYGATSPEHTTGTLILGVEPGSIGSYDLLPGSILTDALAIVGDAGEGRFRQVGSTHNALGDVIVGNRATGVGYYTLESCDLEVLGTLTVGYEGFGQFSQVEATHTVHGDVAVGRLAGSSGYFQMGRPGSLHVDARTTVGDAGYGQFNNADTHTIGADLIIGAQVTGEGEYNMDENAVLLQVAGRTVVGQADVGRFRQRGGSHETFELYLGGDPGGFAPTSDGWYVLQGGELHAGWTVVGQDGVGRFDNISGAHWTDNLLLGNSGGGGGNSSGTCNLMSPGELHTNGTTVGGFGYGEFNQTGGLHEVAFDLVVGDGPETPPGPLPNREGIYNLSGDGELIVHGNTIVGNANNGFAGEPGGKGSFNHAGGTHTISGALHIGRLGSEGAGTGLYELSTGILTADTIDVNQGGFRCSGGVIQTRELIVGAGGDGTFNILNAAADITVSSRLELGPGATFSAVAGSRIRMTGSQFANNSTDPAALGGLSNLTLAFESALPGTDDFEVASEDRGASLAGWDANFALFKLRLGSGAPTEHGRIRLMDSIDNQGDGGFGDEAQYVEWLEVNAGASIDVNGLKLYYRNGGNAKEFFNGDATLDGAVDVSDLSILAGNFRKTTGQAWANGDFNGDGAVDVSDLSLLAGNFRRSTAVPPAATVPEPATLALLGLGAAGLVRRRRRAPGVGH